MPRGSDLLGLPVLEAGSGRRLGRVQDLVLSAGGDRVLGLVLERAGWLRAARVLDWRSVQAVGDAAVLVQGAFWLTGPGPAWGELSGRPLLSTAGAELGRLADLWIDPRSGAVTAYQLSGGLVDDLLAGQTLLPGPAPLRPGPEAVMLADPIPPEGGGG